MSGRRGIKQGAWTYRGEVGQGRAGGSDQAKRPSSKRGVSPKGFLGGRGGEKVVDTKRKRLPCWQNSLVQEMRASVYPCMPGGRGPLLGLPYDSPGEC